MPIEFEDTGRSEAINSPGTDISGTPDPIRTPHQQASEANRSANQNERRPQPQQGGGSNPLQGAADAVGGVAQKAGQLAKSAGLSEPKGDDFNPIDWAKQQAEDAGVVWGFARHAYRALGGAYDDGVTNLFSGQDARSKIMQSGAMGAIAGAIPILGLKESTQEALGGLQVLQGHKGAEQQSQEQSQDREQAVKDAPGAAANLGLFALPGSTAGRAAQVAIPLFEQLAGGNPEDQHSALAWAAVGSLLSFGHLPPQVRKILTDRMEEWPALEKILMGRLDSRTEAARAAGDPKRAASRITSWMDEQLSRGAMEGGLGSRPLARKLDPNKPKEVKAEMTPEGAIKILPSQARKDVTKLLNRVGVADVDELVHKIREEGISDPVVVDAVKKNWKELGLPYDLNRYHPQEMPLRDPRRHLDDLPNAVHGQKHVAAINHYLDQIHRGLFANHANPMVSVLRSLAGHSRTTNLVHQQYMASMADLLHEEMGEPAQAAIMRAAEGDQEAYDKLSSAAKLVVDGWGLIRAAAREESKDTEYASNFRPNWVPRTDRDPEEMTRGRGRPSTKGILSRESRRHREESLQVIGGAPTREEFEKSYVYHGTSNERAAQAMKEGHSVERKSRKAEDNFYVARTANRAREYAKMSEERLAEQRGGKVGADVGPGSITLIHAKHVPEHAWETEDPDYLEWKLHHPLKPDYVIPGDVKDPYQHIFGAEPDTSPAQVVMGQRFLYTSDANKALGAARNHLIAQLINPEGTIPKALADDPEVKGIRRALAEGLTDEAGQRAKLLANQRYPDKESGFMRNVNRVTANQVRAVTTHQALNEFLKTTTKDGRAAAVKPTGQRQIEEFSRQGYQSVSDQRFRGFMFHPELADNLGRYINHIQQPSSTKGELYQKLLSLEGKAVASIMFSPAVHALNVAGRLGMGAMLHPVQMAHYLKHGKALLPHQWDEASWQLRSEAYNAGLIPHQRNLGYADSLLSRMHDALGDTEVPLPEQSAANTLKDRMKGLVAPAAGVHNAVNNHFWGAVSDFGVMMYHLEKAGAEKGGMASQAAMEYAARRANTWMGTVAPEDTNPALHDLSRLIMFAPNWWRSWAELLVPIYKRSGFTQDPAYAKFAAMQGAKATMAALAFQKMTGNAVNYLTTSSTPWAHDGHLQNQNQPGSQDRIEMTGGWLDGVPGVSLLAKAGDPKTGSVRTMENPLARQTYDIEQALGLQSGYSDWKPSDTWDGLSRFVAGRLSPIFDAGMGALNVDLYQTLVDHQARAINPYAPAGELAPANLLYGALMMTPFGLQFSQQVQRNAASGQENPVASALGTKVPGTWQSALQDVGDPIGRTLFSWLTGVNAPYDISQKTRGIKPSDQDYQRVAQLQTDYQQHMQKLSAEALSGQMTPSQWRTAYQDLSRQHTSQMEALYKNSPSYVNGADGMLAQWEDLYRQATKQDGTLDSDHLSLLQASFRQQHTATQMQQMQTQLRQSDSKYPMLALYHRSLDAYDQWQAHWATQNNVDLARLRKEITEYGGLYGDPQQSRRYLAAHGELRGYEAAKRQQFERSPMGMVHSMFNGNSAAVNRYLRFKRLTAAQFAQQEATA